MASNNISKYYKVDKGLDLTSDSQFATLSANEKIVYKPSGEKYIKNSNYSNVFDKTDTFGELEDTFGELEEKVDTKIISKIDDADTNGVCSCKNNNNTQIDTFACHISKTSNNPTLSWGQTSTIGTVDGTPLTVKMPGNPNTDTKYYAGTGLSLNGTEFSISQDLLDKINNSGSTNIKGLFWAQQKTYSHSTEGGNIIIMPEISQKYPGSELYQNCTYDEASHTLVLSDPLNNGTYICVNPSRLYLGYTASGSVYNGHTTTSHFYSKSYERGTFAPDRKSTRLNSSH